MKPKSITQKIHARITKIGVIPSASKIRRVLEAAAKSSDIAKEIDALTDEAVFAASRTPPRKKPVGVKPEPSVVEGGNSNA